jgi:hypothetical protein
MRNIKGMIAVAILLIIVEFSASAAFGQAITGTLLGTVLDSSGGSVAGAEVTATNMDTGVGRRTTTGAEGYYSVPNLHSGHYSVTVKFAGFKTATSQDITVQVQQTTRADFTMSAGDISQQVEVTSEVPLVQSTSSDIGSVIAAKEINNLPLNGRLFEQLVTITPGAAAAGWSDFAENPSAAGAVTPTQAVVNGLPWSGNLYMVDGIHNEEPLNAFISITTPLAAIQEFKIETSNPTAEYGSFGGAVVNLTTKSGTNNFHGELFEYIRNGAFNASDRFSKTKAPYHANQFGGAIGGPIKKDKIFIFGDYQQLLQHNGVTNTRTVPTALQRQGILTEGTQPPITDAAACTPNPCTSNTVPASDINPISKALLDPTVIPLPNVPGALVNNFKVNTLDTQNVPQFDVRVDYAMSDKDRFFVRESYAHRDFTNPPPGTVFMFADPNSTSANHNAVISWDHIFSGTTTNALRIGFNRYFTSDSASSNSIDENNKLGIPNGNLAAFPNTSGIAQFNIPGFGNGDNHLTGDPGWTNAVRIANIFEYSDNVIMIRGKHSIKFGGDIQRVQSTLTNSQNDPRGIFNFQGSYTGNQFADFLVGLPNQVIRDFVATRPGVRITFAGFFAQDDFRVTRKLTLNVGLRWDLYTTPVDVHNHQSNFVPSTGLIQIASPSNRGPNVDTYYGNWGPRVGLAYSPDNGRTAFRAAYGISYFPDNFGADGGTLERNYPFFLIITEKANSQTDPAQALKLSNGLPVAPTVTTTPGATLTPPPNFAVFVVSKNFRQDAAQVWNISVERQLMANMSFRAAYVGTHGTHLYRDLQLDQCNPAVAAITPPPACLPFFSVAPTITEIHQRNGDGYSHYNSGQFELQKRTNIGLTLIGSYTWSKMIDNVSNVVYPYDDRLNRGLSSGFKGSDIPHNLTVSYNYDLPFGRGRTWLSDASGTMNYIVSGWSASGITTFQSGVPLQITVAENLLGNLGGSNPADLTCKHVSEPKTVSEWFDTNCFANPAPFTFGNSGIGHVRGPGISNWDFSLAKATPLGAESRQLRFEANFFNLFNTPHFSNPGTTFGAGGFGVIGSTRLPPRYIQFGLKLSF